MQAAGIQIVWKSLSYRVFIVVSMRMVTFCDIKPCGMVEIYKYSEEPPASIIMVYEGNVFLQIAGKFH